MPNAVSSQKMFRVGLILAIVGIVFYVVMSPVLNWAINQVGYMLPIGMIGGLFSVLQQGTFLGGLFLLVGSFVVRSAEEAVAEIRQGRQAHPHAEQD